MHLSPATLGWLSVLLSFTPRASLAQSDLWTWTTKGVGLLTEGQLVESVDAFARARQVRAVAELDAMVGLVAMEGGRHREALEQLDASISRGTTEPAVLYWAGRAAYSARRPRAALIRLQQAVAIGGDRPLFRMGYALVLNSLGQREQALDSLMAVAASQPNLLDPSLYPTAVEGAIDLLTRVLSGFPRQLQLIRTQGHLLWKRSRYLAATKRFETLLKKRPHDTDALAMVARGKAALGLLSEALALADRAVKLAPDSAQALATRGEILLETGRASKALDDLRKAADAYPKDSRLLARLARACTEAERPACAHRFFNHAVNQDATNAAAHFGIALHHQQRTDLKLAAESFKRAIALDPANHRYYRAAADLARLMGDRRWASALLADARRTAALDRRLRRHRKQVQRTNLLVSAALGSLEKTSACEENCRRLPAVPRRFLQAHLLLRRSKKRAARAHLAAILSSLRWAPLLGRDPTIYQISGKTIKGQRVILRNIFPLAPLASFR